MNTLAAGPEGIRADARDEGGDGDEVARLLRLRALAVLDTPREAFFDEAVRLAATICETPIALVSLVDEHRQWFKANLGLEGTTETPRDVAFCAHTIQGRQLFEVTDAARDPRFAGNPLVTSPPNIRFYAGMPLVMPEGHRMGTLCVIDRQPRVLSASQRALLARLGELVSAALIDRQEAVTRAAALSSVLEAELFRQRADLRAILDNVPAMIGYLDRDLRYRFANREYVRWFGKSPEDVIGRHVRELIGADMFDRNRVAMDAALAGQRQDFDRDLPGPDGVLRFARASYIPDRVDGNVEGFFVMVVDISDRRRAEQALVESEQRYRSLYEETPAMMQSIDPDGRLLSVSDRWLEDLGGYSRDEVLGRPAIDLLTPECRQRAIEVNMPALFREGRVDGVPCQMIRRDGDVIDVEVSSILERHPDGTPRRSLAVVSDVTQRNQLSGELAAERDRLRDALREKEVLLREVHHRVKNNLQVISSLLLLQSAAFGDASVRAGLDATRERIRSIALVHEQLCQSRNLSQVDLGAYVGRLVMTVYQALGGHDRGIGLDLDVEAVAVPIDIAVPAGLLLNELLSNALKHGFPDGRRGTVHLAVRRTSRGAIELVVRDDGVGLPDGVVPGKTQSLGLELVSTFAAQLEGQMAVSCPVGGGTEVRVALETPDTRG